MKLEERRRKEYQGKNQKGFFTDFKKCRVTEPTSSEETTNLDFPGHSA